ncbi:diguanylate cyclase [Sphingomonas sp. S1-29]|uniref:GGDEF domain-containing protein n=1 Tax=Sphingomonas sp. S1-29 TaxID=2991074 RepID=UPI0022407A33|nr:diguanylate cyclase [Sphingomonas sp. S1-29]UZK70458.1 diguanylate cyclase [Sphingomonas sp. S1-29]
MKTAFDNARAALAFLESHRLEPSVGNYALALQYVENRQSDLGRAIAAETDGGLRLTHEAADRLQAQYVRRGSDFVTRQREQAVTRHAEELDSLTADAHELTSALERDVGTIVAQSTDWPKATGEFVIRLSEAERDLAELRSEFAKFKDQIGNADVPANDPNRDEMTQALNQGGAHPLLQHLAKFERGYVLILFSLDALPLLNNRFGRPVGDNVLNALAGTLRQVFTQQELIRWDGNEFVVLMKDTALVAARTLTEEALAAMESRRLKLRGSGEGIGIVTASAGLAVGQGEDATTVLARARELALLAAASGGNCCKE